MTRNRPNDSWPSARYSLYGGALLSRDHGEIIDGTYGGTANVYSDSSHSLGWPPPRLAFSRSSILVAVIMWGDS
jgi:hypothetical protein